jgi:adenosylcobinamide-phosphate synthase
MRSVEARCWRDTRAAGAVHASVGVSLGAAAGAALGSTTAATWLAVGGRSLWTAARDVGRALEECDLDRARALLPSLVGRDPSGLDEKDIARAAVESVAENTVDAIVAPALWAATGGAPAALAYRAVNTLDAMVGHRSPRYGRYGWASARLDDLANVVPARATAALVATVRPRTAARVLTAVRHDALGVTLGGVNVYAGRVEERPRLGEGPPPGAADIVRAVRLSSDVAWALTAALVALSGRRPRASGRG